MRRQPYGDHEPLLRPRLPAPNSDLPAGTVKKGALTSPQLMHDTTKKAATRETVRAWTSLLFKNLPAKSERTVLNEKTIIENILRGK
jgi:hypothetical protein